MQGQPHQKKLASREVGLADYVPFSAHVTPSIIKNRDGCYLATWRLEGIPFETTDTQELNIRHEAFNQLIRGLPLGTALWSHRIRRRQEDRLSTNYSEAFARETAERYYDSFAGYRMMANEFYLTVVYRPELQRVAPSSGLGRILGARPIRKLEAIERDELEALKVFREIVHQIEAGMKPYNMARLEGYEQNGQQYSELLSFLGYLLNGVWQRVPMRREAIASYLPVNRLFCAEEHLEIRTPDQVRYAGVLDLQDYPEYTMPGSLDDLMREPYEFIETQSFTILSRPDAKTVMERQTRQLLATEDAAGSQIAAMDQALDELISGRFAYGEYHYSLVVFADSLDEVGKSLAAARSKLNDGGFQAALVDLVADAAWFAQMPGNWRYRPRAANLTSRNFAGLSSFHGYLTGKRDGNPWGEAVTLLKTKNASPYYFNWHGTPDEEDSTDKKAPANTMIIGMTGSGKTVLELFLLTMSLKYHPTVVFFDKDRGAEIAIRALGGNYRCLKRGQPTGFNPFQLEPNETNLRFQEVLVASLVPRHLTPAENTELNRAIRQVSRMPLNLRRLSIVRQQLQNTSEDCISAHLAKWCADGSGQLAWVLDNPTDTINLHDGRIFGFDDTDFMEDPEVLGPVTMYLLHLTESLLDGRRFIYVMAEFWKRLQLPVFADFAVNKQYTIRKQNGFGVFDTQSPAQILKTPHVAAMVEQSATQIYLPNPRADFDDYVQGFKLTENEFETIRSLGEASRQFLVKQGHRSGVVQLELGPLGDLLDILSTSLDNVEMLDGIRAEVGDDPQDWIPLFKERLLARRSQR